MNEHVETAEEYLLRAARAQANAARAESDWERDAYLADATLCARIAQVHATLATVK